MIPNPLLRPSGLYCRLHIRNTKPAIPSLEIAEQSRPKGSSEPPSISIATFDDSRTMLPHDQSALADPSLPADPYKINLYINPHLSLTEDSSILPGIQIPQNLSKVVIPATHDSGSSRRESLGALIQPQMMLNPLIKQFPEHFNAKAAYIGLHLLYLDGNQFLGELPRSLGKLENVTATILSKNHFSGSVPEEIGGCRAMESLDFWGNNLPGTIPLLIGKLSSLISLCLSDNQLVGPLPTEIGICSSLVELELHDNLIGGPIPSQVAKLRNPEKNWLSNYQLEGTIPPEIGKLCALWDLQLYNNCLTTLNLVKQLHEQVVTIALSRIRTLSTYFYDDLSQIDVGRLSTKRIVSSSSRPVIDLCQPRIHLDENYLLHLNSYLGGGQVESQVIFHRDMMCTTNMMTLPTNNFSYMVEKYLSTCGCRTWDPVFGIKTLIDDLFGEFLLSMT